MSEMDSKIVPPMDELVAAVVALSPVLTRGFTVTCDRRVDDLFLTLAVRVDPSKSAGDAA